MSKAWVQKEERWAGERKKSRELSTQWGKFISPGILALQGKGCLFHIALQATVFLPLQLELLHSGFLKTGATYFGIEHYKIITFYFLICMNPSTI